jgi:hypothetical protein
MVLEVQRYGTCTDLFLVRAADGNGGVIYWGKKRHNMSQEAKRERMGRA